MADILDCSDGRSLAFDKERSSRFSYTCNACNRCCYHKTIQVGPYELVRLSRALGMSTTEFLAAYTEAGGTALRVQPNGACVFLTPTGCGVHPDRPLVCRLYPLGRVTDSEGRERFADLPPHPETAGCYSSDGTVGSYLELQGVAPYFAFGERYAALYRRMVALSTRLGHDTRSQEGQSSPSHKNADDTPPGSPLSPWLDVDATVAAYCDERGLAVPTAETDEVIDLHIRAVEAWLAGLEASVA